MCVCVCMCAHVWVCVCMCVCVCVCMCVCCVCLCVYEYISNETVQCTLFMREDGFCCFLLSIVFELCTCVLNWPWPIIKMNWTELNCVLILGYSGWVVGSPPRLIGIGRPFVGLLKTNSPEITWMSTWSKSGSVTMIGPGDNMVTAPWETTWECLCELNGPHYHRSI